MQIEHKKLLGHIKLLDSFTTEMDQVEDRISDLEDKIDELVHSDSKICNKAVQINIPYKMYGPALK